MTSRTTRSGSSERAGTASTSRTAPRPRTGSRATVGNTALAPRPTSPAPAGAARRRPALSVVPPIDAHAPRTPFVLLVLVLVGAGLVGLLLLNTAINENAFRLHDLQQDQDALDLREQQLHRDIERLEAPGTLQAAARRLGLVPAGNPAYIYLPSGQVVGVPTPGRATAPPPSAVTRPAPKPSTAATTGGAVKPTTGTATKPGTAGATKPGAAKPPATSVPATKSQSSAGRGTPTSGTAR